MRKHTSKLLLATITLCTATLALANDVLNESQWKSIDDSTGKPKALIQFKQQNNGTLSAMLIKRLDTTDKLCHTCEGTYKDKSLEGVTVVNNLKAESTGKYDGGTILDPKTGKSYKMKAELSADGKRLTVRGYMGISVFGRSQTWIKAN